MQGGAQYEYLLERIDILEFHRLQKMVTKLNKEQEANAKAGATA